MGALKDLTGHVVGKWSVLCRDGSRGSRGEVLWVCRCVCGTEKSVIAGNLLKKASTSCGCANRIGNRSTTHGHTRLRSISPTYHTWAGMKARCNNPKNTHYSHYGAQGIQVCERWAKFEMFLEDMGEKPKNHSLDRIDPNGNYEPQNCRWADDVTQARNKRNNRYLTAFGKTMTLQQWAIELKVTHGALIFRIDKAKWPLEKALSTPATGRGGRPRKP